MTEFSAADIANIKAPTMAMLKLDDRRIATFTLSYQRAWDMLYIREGDNRPALSKPVGPEGWLRYDPATFEIVGANVEDFERSFLVRHPILRKKWRQVKRHLLRQPAQAAPDGAAAVLIRQVMDCLTTPPSEDG